MLFSIFAPLNKRFCGILKYEHTFPKQNSYSRRKQVIVFELLKHKIFFSCSSYALFCFSLRNSFEKIVRTSST